MKLVLLLVGLAFLVALAAILLWRQGDHRADRAMWQKLLQSQPANPATFDPAMLADLPDPARRFFRYAIAEGAPLFTVAELTMTGTFDLGTKSAPNPLAMTAKQLLAAPQGFVWEMSAARGVIRVSGSDSGDWTRFWAMGIAPVARAGGTRDDARAAFGRLVSEAIFWTPAAVLPRPGVRWQAIDADTARLTITHGDLVQSVDLSVTEDGQPTEVRFDRWSNANPDNTFRLQPFGGTLSAFRDFDGFRVPTHVEAGNFFGTDDYFPFFIADITNVRFPQPATR